MTRLQTLTALLGVFGTSLACGTADTAHLKDGVDTRTPVLVELFTSEGCSSCPPADQLLGRLIAEQPVPGVRIVGIGEHVDYWNRLSWSDRFSTRALTDRQFDYQSEVFPSNVVYTPQAVIDGAFECIGSDLPALEQAIEQAARVEKATVRVTASSVGVTGVGVTIDVDVPRSLPRGGPADVLLAIVEDGLASQVSGGENRGKTLEHVAVVRWLEGVGHVEHDRSGGSFSTTVPVENDWNPSDLRVVAFVQERTGRKIIGVGDARAH